MEIGARACVEAAAGVIRIDQRVGRRLGESLRENADVFQGAQLVVTDAAIVMRFVQLQFHDSQHEVGGATVAGHTFGSARKTPDLSPDAARRTGILDDKLFLVAFRCNQRRIGLAFIPAIGVSNPLPILTGEQSGLDPLP